MTLVTDQASAGGTTAPSAPAAPPTDRRRWWRQRTELGFAAGVLAIAAFMIVQTITMDVPEGVGAPGPRFFPGLVAGFLILTGGLLAINVIRTPRHTAATSTMGQLSTDMLEDLASIDDPVDSPTTTAPAAAGGSDYVPVDYRTTGIVIAGLVGFAILLQPVGWLITSSALFWIVSRALGSRRPVFDIAVSVIFASVIQIAFSAGLGLGLPAGILEGVVPWSN
ncbi:tripartite tricarboxylate transporter TctB family protein [Dietzia sp. DQ12-76]|uniref:tripartite tricarboxylate transporter TctB family protein n=3 Tax=unclassified Dietzia TaxID=2617939 RepID=UPI0015FBB307|nr:tripartite tricarboxylate transporter TctB family protein [Dietzia sp. DQ12-76]MBB1024594.1 tripartite tricarboxylate transporter TctB family protein [Dietzia sp. DQ12-76]